MKVSTRAALGLLLSGLIFLAVFFLRDFLLVNIVQPIALVLWLGSRLLSTIDQAVYWTILVLVVIFTAFMRLSFQPALPKTEEPSAGNATLHSMVHWRTLILLTSDETDRLNFFKHSLTNLLKDVYASKQPSEVPWKVYEGFEEGEYALPARIRDFLHLNPAPETPPSLAKRLERFGQASRRWLRRRNGQDRAEYYQSIAEVISYMEQQLESDDDR